MPNCNRNLISYRSKDRIIKQLKPTIDNIRLAIIGFPPELYDLFENIGAIPHPIDEVIPNNTANK